MTTPTQNTERVLLPDGTETTVRQWSDVAGRPSPKDFGEFDRIFGGADDEKLTEYLMHIEDECGYHHGKWERLTQVRDRLRRMLQMEAPQEAPSKPKPRRTGSRHNPEAVAQVNTIVLEAMGRAPFDWHTHTSLEHYLCDAAKRGRYKKHTEKKWSSIVCATTDRLVRRGLAEKRREPGKITEVRLLQVQEGSV